jgi:hypothetical protein
MLFRLSLGFLLISRPSASLHTLPVPTFLALLAFRIACFKPRTFCLSTDGTSATITTIWQESQFFLSLIGMAKHMTFEAEGIHVEKVPDEDDLIRRMNNVL